MQQASVVLDLSGTPVPARLGETVAAALTRAGIKPLRHGQDGCGRGVFCGMGVCQDCVLEIDGVPLRACMTPVSGPHRLALGGIATGEGFPPPLPPIAIEDIPISTPDVLVIGGGAAGLAASIAAAEAGAEVVMIDERSRTGGQYFKQPWANPAARDDRQFFEWPRLDRAGAAHRRAHHPGRRGLGCGATGNRRGIVVRGPFAVAAARAAGRDRRL